MKAKILQLSYYLGISVLIISMLFKIQHWYGSFILFLIGISLEILFVLFILIEMITSKKVEKETKIIWILYYICFPFFVFVFAKGLLLILLIVTIKEVYFRQARKYFVPIRKDIDKIEFDSI